MKAFFRVILIYSIILGISCLSKTYAQDINANFQFKENIRLTICNQVGEPIQLTNLIVSLPISSTISNSSISSTSIPILTTNIIDGGYLTITTVQTTNNALSQNVSSTLIQPSQIILKGTLFEIVKVVESSDMFVIRIFYKNKDIDFNARYTGLSKDTVTKQEQIFYFLLPKKVFETKCKEALVRHSFTVGALLLPIKMRFGSGKTVTTTSQGSTQSITTHPRNFQISSDVNVGLMIGYKYRKTENRILSLLAGISISSVPLTPETTANAISSSTNASAVTVSTGFLYQIDDFQVGMFLGLDFLSGEIAHKWVYREKPWLGIGLGFSIFSTKSTKEKN